MFFTNETIMMPVWLPWMIVGGFIFTLLGFIGTKYKDKEYKKIQSIQDFISGSILIAFTGVLVPDLFPKMELPVSLPVILDKSSGDSDFELQVGPPRLAGR